MLQQRVFLLHLHQVEIVLPQAFGSAAQVGESLEPRGGEGHHHGPGMFQDGNALEAQGKSSEDQEQGRGDDQGVR